MFPSIIRLSLKTLKKGFSIKSTTAKTRMSCINISNKFFDFNFFIICIYKINQGIALVFFILR